MSPFAALISERADLALRKERPAERAAPMLFGAYREYEETAVAPTAVFLSRGKIPDVRSALCFADQRGSRLRCPPSADRQAHFRSGTVPALLCPPDTEPGKSLRINGENRKKPPGREKIILSEILNGI